MGCKRLCPFAKLNSHTTGKESERGRGPNPQARAKSLLRREEFAALGQRGLGECKKQNRWRFRKEEAYNYMRILTCERGKLLKFRGSDGGPVTCRVSKIPSGTRAGSHYVRIEKKRKRQEQANASPLFCTAFEKSA
jgi:hypothetical protein